MYSRNRSFIFRKIHIIVLTFHILPYFLISVKVFYDNASVYFSPSPHTFYKRIISSSPLFLYESRIGFSDSFHTYGDSGFFIWVNILCFIYLFYKANILSMRSIYVYLKCEFTTIHSYDDCRYCNGYYLFI